MNDLSEFPHPVYKRTVLEPLFDGALSHYVEPVRAINRAHLVMLFETGIVQPEQCRAIAGALNDIDTSLSVDDLTYTGEFEDYFFLVESELVKRLGVDVAGLLHTARSRNDMDHTIFKMVLKGHTQSLLALALDLAESLASKATTERDTLIVAYTHGQPAQPTTFGHYLAAALEVLLRDITRVTAAMDALNHCPMGAAAITTSGFPINRDKVAHLLGFSTFQRNSYGCIAAVDYVTGLYSSIKLMFLHLGRVIQDLQFWTAFEVGQLYIPNSLVQISSIMPQKRNPVPIEHLRHLASVTCGRCDTIVNTMHNTPFTDMNDSEGEVQQAGYSAFGSASRVLELLSALLTDCEVQHQRVAATTKASCITVTELADTLVREDQLSFRQAHEIAAVTAQAVIARQHSLDEGYNDFADAFADHTNRVSRLDEAAYRNAVAARTFVQLRDRPGGPAPDAMDESLSVYRSEIHHQQKNLETRKRQQDDADIALNNAFLQLTQG